MIPSSSCSISDSSVHSSGVKSLIWLVDFTKLVSMFSNKVSRLMTLNILHIVSIFSSKGSIFFSFYLNFRPVPRIKLVKKGIHAPLGKTTGNVNRLVIDSFGPDDAGKYKCRASDKAGQSDTKTTVIRMEGIKLLCRK